MVKLDIACGNSKRGEDYIGVDIAKTPAVDVVHDLNVYPWPFEAESVDEIYCSHYIEHIPHDIPGEDKRDGLIQFMDECYRILKPGGKLFLVAPYGKSSRALGDPTHRRSIVDETFSYYNKSIREAWKLEHYNINCNFDVVMSYYISNDLTLKSEEVRNKAFKHDWNAIDDIMAELTKI
jgi:predicted SAM-dependent methyltransferase